MQPLYAMPTHKSPALAVAQPVRKNRTQVYLLIGALGIVALFVAIFAAIALGLSVVVSSNRIMPGVSVAGISVNGMTIDEASQKLTTALTQITLRDVGRTWTLPAAQIGITVDAKTSAANAQDYGRGQGSLINAFFGAQVAPIVKVDLGQAQKGLQAFASITNKPAANAAIRMVNGQIAAVPATNGRVLDVPTTLARLVAGKQELADGALDLAMTETRPTVTDATPLLNSAKALLASPLTIAAFDPISNQTANWTVPADKWGQWLTTNNSQSGLVMRLDDPQLANYLNGQNPSLGTGNYVDVKESATTIQSAIQAGTPNATIRVYHTPSKYTVRAGETLTTIYWKYGISMYRLMKANPDVDLQNLSVGQTITIPSKDEMLPLPIVFNKRIVVSISKQHMWVYENGQIKWNWAASTGIDSSPTMPGVFEVQSHESNAYAGNWNLYMPSFMGIYEPIPGFMNGIHGFPSRGGYQILWENSLGYKVTYGCILLDSNNAKQLYAWAENGVVVEIQP